MALFLLKNADLINEQDTTAEGSVSAPASHASKQETAAEGSVYVERNAENTPNVLESC